MKTRAAILWEVGKDWSVEEIDLDPPKQHEASSSWLDPDCASPTSIW